jgi:deoxyhypusine synthase
VLVTGQCLAPTYMGDFHLKGAELRREGLNRIGNMLVPNSNYCAFEDWIMPVFEAMLREQQEQDVHWTPSSVRSSMCQIVASCCWHYIRGIAVIWTAATLGFLRLLSS